MKRIRLFIFSLGQMLDGWLFNLQVRMGLILQMASTAVSAQGSTFQIGSTSGTPATISGVAIGFPTIITATAHGFSNGDQVTFSGIVGTLSALNGQSFVVRDKLTNTFSIDYDSTGLAYTSGGTATPVTWIKVSNVKTFAGLDGAAAEIDTTNLDSAAKEFHLGLVDSGQMQIEVDQDDNDAGQQACLAAQSGALLKPFKLTLPNGKTATFNGYVKKVDTKGGVDQVVKRAIDIRISGAVTRA